MRTGGAEALAFDVACLAGPQAALPHGAPRDRPVLDGAVLLFDFGAQVAGYRSDMTRTLFVGEPRERDLAIYDLVATAQAAVIETLELAVADGAGRDGAGRCRTGTPSTRSAGISSRLPAMANTSGTGRAMGSAWRRTRRRASASAPRRRHCPVRPSSRWSRGSTSRARPGSASRISSLLDGAAGRVERLTAFPREVIVVG